MLDYAVCLPYKMQMLYTGKHLVQQLRLRMERRKYKPTLQDDAGQWQTKRQEYRCMSGKIYVYTWHTL